MAKPQLSWFKPNDIDAGTELNLDQLNAKASVEGQFVYDPPLGTVFEIRGQEAV